MKLLHHDTPLFYHSNSQDKMTRTRRSATGRCLTHIFQSDINSKFTCVTLKITYDIA